MGNRKNIMNIDAKIQEILLRSSPCNDNAVKNITHPTNSYRSISNISIVGNNNVIVSSGLWMLYFLLAMFYTWILVINS